MPCASAQNPTPDAVETQADAGQLQWKGKSRMAVEGKGRVYVLSPNAPQQIAVENDSRTSILIQNVGAASITIAPDAAPEVGKGMVLDGEGPTGGQGGSWERIGPSYCPRIAAPSRDTGPCPGNSWFAVAAQGS